MIENNKLNNPPSDDVLEKLCKVLKLSETEIDYLYKLVDEKTLPKRVQIKIKELDNEIEQLKIELKKCNNQLNIKNNNNNGHIIVGSGNNIKYSSYAGTELCKELNELDDKQREKE